MKILFIDPPFQRFMGFHRYYYPLGLAYMAAVLQQQGHLVRVYDGEHTTNAYTLPWALVAQNYDEYPKALGNDHHPIWAEIKTILNDFQPDVVGLSVLSVKVPSAAKIAALSKQFNKNITVIAGADHPTVFPDQTLRDPNIDIVVRGEGENTIVELMAQLEKGASLEAVAGISYKVGLEVKHNPVRPLIANLDEIPYPAITTLINYEMYRPVDFGAIMASRGCPYPCTFCGIFNIWTRQVRFRSPANIVSEMKWLQETYGTEYFSFRDASFTLKREWVIAICQEIIRQNLIVQWEVVTRADFLDDALLVMMKRAGCVTVRIGVESGDEQILRYMKKKVDLDSIRQAAKLLYRHNFYWSAYFLFGIPLETKDSIQKTLDFIKEINPPFVTMARFAPIPGTEMYEELAHVGLISPDIDWGMESNQRFRTNYVYALNESEFESIMQEVAEFVLNHNNTNSTRLGVRDGRWKD